MFNVAVGSPKPPKGNRITDGTLFIPSVSGKSYTKNKQCLIIKIMNIIKKLLGEGYPKLGSEVNVIKAIGLDCKPFICTDDESEKTQANA